MKKYNPTTPSRRFITHPDYNGLSTDRPLKSLTKSFKKNAGRNAAGRITVRHQGGGHKALYRLLDFKQNKPGIVARVETIEYDPYRTAFIARVVYADGERRYILAPQGLKIGNKIIGGKDSTLEVGNRTLLKRIPIGTFVHNVELFPGRGGTLGRSAGTSLQVLANEDGYTHLKLPSGEVRKVPWDSSASIGQVSNPEYNFMVVGKAGRQRHRGVRPTVRGSAMNPVDHKYGGGEGRAKRGTRRPKDIWGNITGGRKTRKKKRWSNKLIIKRRK